MFEANQNEMNFAKMKHNIISAAAALLSALILVQALRATVSADGSGEATEAPAPGISYAPPARKIVFPDVASDDWFYDDVMALVSDGILNGYPDGSFRPELDVTNAEFIKMIVAAVGGAEGARAMFPESWASGYITAAYERGIITDEDLTGGFSPDKPITRSAMTKMIVLALGIEPARIDDPFTDISDMYASTAYNEYLLRGYPDGNGGRVYDGAGNASRSEAASMTVRLIEYAKDPYAFRRDAVLENASNNVLGSEFELIDLFYILNREFMSEFTFRTTIPLSVWSDYYVHSNTINLEYFYSTGISVKYSKALDAYTITLQYDRDISELKKLHRKAEEKADKVISSIITPTMTGLEKVKAIHDYIILNCEYDYANYLADTLPYETRLAYGVLIDKKAVCQGYSAAFNLLAERAGLRSVAIGGYAPNSNVRHSWNMVLVNGQIYFVDTTHDDPVPDKKGKISYKYFCLTESEMASLGYFWEKSHSNIKYFY